MRQALGVRHSSARHAAGDGGTIAGVYVRQILDALLALVVDAHALRPVLGPGVAELDDPSVRPPVGVAPRLFARAQRLADDPLVGLHAGQVARFRGPLAHLLASAPRLRTALEMFSAFCRMAVDTAQVRLVVSGDTAMLVLEPQGGSVAQNRHFIDYVLLGTVRACWQRAHPGLRPSEIHVRHAGRVYGDEAATAFGCPVRFGMPAYRIVFSAADLDTPRAGAAVRAAAATGPADAAPPAVAATPVRFDERVEQATRGLLVQGRPASEAEVARRLHVSVRSLQRRLGGESTSFRQVRDRVLLGLVEAQLWNPALSIKAIALGLGFADVAALSKAFRRWTGQAPSTWRARIFAHTATRPAPTGEERRAQRPPSRSVSRVGPRSTMERR